MSDKPQRFNAPDSVLSKINGSGNLNQDLGQVTNVDTTTGINSNITETEGLSNNNSAEYQKIRESEYKDPGLSANKELVTVKNPQKVEAPDVKDTNPNPEINVVQNPDGSFTSNSQVKDQKTSRESGNSEQGWLQREAMRRMNQSMSDSTTNVKDNQEADAPNTNTDIQKSRQKTVGKVPAIDHNTPKPKQPKTNYPSPEYTAPQYKQTATPPQVRMPKFSVPKLKLR